MKRSLMALAAAVLLITLAPSGVVAQSHHGQGPPGSTTRHQFRAEGASLAGPFEIVHLVLDYAPGVWTPPHTHGGQAVVTVVEGAMTVRQQGTEKTYRPGEGWAEAPNVEHQVGNTAAHQASVLVTVLLPKGAPLTTASGSGGQQAPPGPTVRHQFRAEGATVASPFEVVHLVLDFGPGAWTPPHTHGGQGIVTVLGGTMTRRVAGVETVYRPGENWIEPGVVHQAGNDAADPAAVMVTFLLPKGAPLTKVATPGIPNAGAGGSADQAGRLWLPLLLVVAIVAGGAIGRRWTRRMERS
jgi:quercetin dioxygenase-like cupin family protein